MRPRYGWTNDAGCADLGSDINLAKPDAVLLALDHRGLPLNFAAGDLTAEQQDIANAMAQLNAIRSSLHANAGTVCIVQTIPTPPEALFGSMDQHVPGTPRSLIGKLNQAIGDSISGTPDLILDVARLAETIGLATWHSPALWNSPRSAATRPACRFTLSTSLDCWLPCGAGSESVSWLTLTIRCGAG